MQALVERPDAAFALEACHRMAELHERVRSEFTKARAQAKKGLKENIDNPSPQFVENLDRIDRLHIKLRVIDEWLDLVKESIGALLTKCGAREGFTPTAENVFPFETLELDMQIETLREIKQALSGQAKGGQL